MFSVTNFNPDRVSALSGRKPQFREESEDNLYLTTMPQLFNGCIRSFENLFTVREVYGGCSSNDKCNDCNIL